MHEIAVFIVCGLVAYLLPFFIACYRGLSKRWGIGFLNLVLGWTGLIWVGLLFYCVLSSDKQGAEDGFS